VPFEVALWAQHAGPIVVAPSLDGFVEQIDNDATGLLYQPDIEDALTEAVRQALQLPEDQQATMRRDAVCRVRAERAVESNLARTLRFFWH
jgi:glycosyltransferase involved in cell wall biosynthesis